MTNYQRGQRVEQQVSDHLGVRGYDVIRSAASKGAADLVAFHDGEILFVQVKMSERNRTTPAERAELRRIAGRAGGMALVAYKMTDPDDGRRYRFVFRELRGDGPRQWVWWVPRDSRAEEQGEAVFG